jgi:hypothetical protein
MSVPVERSYLRAENVFLFGYFTESDDWFYAPPLSSSVVTAIASRHESKTRKNKSRKPHKKLDGHTRLLATCDVKDS